MGTGRKWPGAANSPAPSSCNKPAPYFQARIYSTEKATEIASQTYGFHWTDRPLRNELFEEHYHYFLNKGLPGTVWSLPNIFIPENGGRVLGRYGPCCKGFTTFGPQPCQLFHVGCSSHKHDAPFKSTVYPPCPGRADSKLYHEWWHWERGRERGRWAYSMDLYHHGHVRCVTHIFHKYL